MQIGRLFEIVYLLMRQENITAKELAERFEVSTRTIYRDIDTLSGAGIPVYSVKGKGGGIRLLPDFVLNKSLLSEQEQSEILFALQTLYATNASCENNVLNRLAALFQKDSANWINVDFSHWGSGEEEKKKFQLLKNAVLRQNVIKFQYYSASGETSGRRAEPHKMTFKKGSWYLQAFCLDRQAFRTFKINRMEQIQPQETCFSPRPIPPFDEIWGGYEKEYPVELWISKRMAYRVYDEFKYSQIKKNPDGSFTVLTSFPLEEWAYSFLLSFGSGIQIKSPPALRERFYLLGKEIAENHRF